MTHDELLAAVQFNKQTLESSDRNSEALRAVVEVHKPERPRFSGKGSTYLCSHCRKENLLHFAIQKSLRVLYPCPTIQAIEKELK